MYHSATQARNIEARRGKEGSSRLEDANNIAGIADGLTGVAANVYGATQARDIQRRKTGKSGGGESNHLENAKNIAGIADSLTGVATNIYG